MYYYLGMTLLETRQKYNLSQLDAAEALKVSLRTYIRYEKDDSYGDEYKRTAFISELDNKYEITEDKGLLTIDYIKDALTQLFDKEYKGIINFCYLFGSYAKGYASEKSDVDLCVDTDLKGLKFVALSEDIRNVLHKKIDLIRFSNLNDNLELVGEILKDGIKIYG